MASSLLLFGVSATYHRFPWGPTVKKVLKRIDHTNILLLIAGTYTPIAICALPHTLMVVVLWVMWSGAALGIAFRVLWIGAPRWLYVPIYLVLGCAALGLLPQFFAASVPMTVLVLSAGSPTSSVRSCTASSVPTPPRRCSGSTRSSTP